MSRFHLFPYESKSIAPQTERPWNIEMTNAPVFWLKTKGDGAVVAVVDTGLDATHPEFAGRVINPRNLTRDGGPQDVTDVIGHGTHVAGIIAGATAGIAPEARIMPIKVFGTGDGFQFQDAFRLVLEWNRTAPEGDRVVAVNCSWGGSYDPVMHNFIRQLVADGVAVVCSAGNAGDEDPETSEIWNWPGFLYEPITVGAVNADGQPAGYSSSYDGIDLGAPGTEVYSAWPGGGYKLLSGTSMAAPHVTGAYALIAAAWKAREGHWPKGGEAEKVLFNHIGKVDADPAFVGLGLLDLAYKTTRWPLWRVQVGAYYNREGAENMEQRVGMMFPTYITKY
jgi:major intracellular serine protease